MNIVVFDTETTSLNKPFCYNIGYTIVDTDQWKKLEAKDFVVEQIWHNLPLFSTAYYAEKRPIYIDAMRKHLTIMDKFGYICRAMHRDFLKYDVKRAFAFNSPFDTKVFDFNCDWFKCNNPFEQLEIVDIRGFAHQFITDNNYLTFCEQNNLFTENGNYSTTAESYFQYLTQNADFSEDHTALSDSIIETYILQRCIESGADIMGQYETKRSIERKITKTLEIVTTTKDHYFFDYEKMRMNKEKTQIILK